jgi:membrane-bound lytic murein transglycosylase
MTPQRPKAAPATTIQQTSASTPLKPEVDDTAPANTDGFTIDEATWQAVLESLKRQYNTLYGIIRMAQPTFLAGKVTLTFGFAFHQKRASDAKNKKILMALLEEVTGQRVGIECKFDKSVTPPSPIVPATPPAAAANPALGAISNIFGGGEVLNP